MSASEIFPATSMPDRDWWAALWPDPDGVLRQMGVQPEMTVFDLCCGDGHFTAPLARLVGGRVYALDLDPIMIDRARAEAARQDASVLQWICADACEVARLLFEQVDYVLMANTFHGVPDKSGLARAVQSLLLPQGLFGIVNWHACARADDCAGGAAATEMRMAPDAVSAVIEPAGFRTAGIIELPPYHYGAILRKLPDGP